jgi:hypothetical protein
MRALAAMTRSDYLRSVFDRRGRRCDQRSDSAREVHRMVTETFVEPCDEGRLDRDRQRHGAACDLGGQYHVEMVEIVV